jgi:hypothetical protein
MSGWIKLHRQLAQHWIWDNSDYLKWWLDILLEVNHTDQKILIKGVLFECKRGEKLYSLDTWAKRWKTNKSKVRRFLDLLQKEKMIVLKNVSVTTHLTVCKYDSYQDERNADETQMKRKRNADETQMTPIQECNNEKNENNEKNDNISFDFKKKLIENGFKENLVDDWMLIRKNKNATDTETFLKKFLEQIELASEDKNEILEFMISKDWRSFEYQWLVNLKSEFEKNNQFYNNKQQQNGKQSISELSKFTASIRKLDPTA